MPALRFQTCRLLLGNVRNRELTIIQRRILRRSRNKKKAIKRKIYPRENLNSYIQLQTTRKLSLFHGDLPIAEMHRGRERTSYIPFLLNPEARFDVILFLMILFLAVSIFYYFFFDLFLSLLWSGSLRFLLSRLVGRWRGLALLISIYNFSIGDFSLSVGTDGASSSYAKGPFFYLNWTKEQYALYVEQFEEVQSTKKGLADLLDPLILRELEKHPGVERNQLPSPTDMVELLIKRIGSPTAKEENAHNTPIPNFKNIKTWLTRACQNAQDEAVGQMSTEMKFGPSFLSLAIASLNDNERKHLPRYEVTRLVSRRIGRVKNLESLL